MRDLPRSASFGAILDSMNRRARWWLTGFALLFAVQIGPLWYPKMDSCVYLSIARSMVQDEKVTNLGGPRLLVVPGYPFVISPAFWFDNQPFLLVSIIHFAAAVCALVGVYLWARRNLPSVAVLLTGLMTLNAIIWLHHRPALKETVCLAVVVWCVNLLQTLLRQPSRQSAVLTTIAAAALLSGGVLIRYSVIALLPGFVLAAAAVAWKGRCRWWYALAVSAVVSIAPSLTLWAHINSEEEVRQQQGASHTYASTYKTTVTESPKTKYFEGLRLQIAGIGRVTIPGMFKSYGPAGEWLNPNMAVYLPWMVVPIAGWWWLVRRREDVFALAAPFYLGLYIPAACDQGCRFLVPMTPILMACAWVGLTVLFAARRHTLALFTVAHLCVAVGYWVVIDAPRAVAMNKKWPEIHAMAATIDEDRWATVVQIPDPEDSHDTQMMLTLALDRAVKAVSVNQPLPEWVQWAVTPQHQPVPHGFRVAGCTGRWQVVERLDEEISPVTGDPSQLVAGRPIQRERH